MYVVTFVVPPEDEHPINTPIRRPYSYQRGEPDGRLRMMTQVALLEEVRWYWPSAEIVHVDPQDWGSRYWMWDNLPPERSVPVSLVRHARPNARVYQRTWMERQVHDRYIPEEEDEFPIYFE